MQTIPTNWVAMARRRRRAARCATKSPQARQMLLRAASGWLLPPHARLLACELSVRGSSAVGVVEFNKALASASKSVSSRDNVDIAMADKADFSGTESLGAKLGERLTQRFRACPNRQVPLYSLQ
eukprot:6164295-Pleurochrysis_carterae.AAC.2